MQLHFAMLAGWVAPADVFVQFYSHEPNSFWLDREHNQDSPYSILGAGKKTLRSDWQPGQFDEIDVAFEWRPGLMGLQTYEGDEVFIAVDRGIVFDHENESIYFVGLFDTAQDFNQWHHAALLRLGLSGGQLANFLHQNQSSETPAKSTLRHDSNAYRAMIRRAQDHIAAGDIYQICLTNEIRIETQANPLGVFLKLRAANPSPYSTYFQTPDFVLACSSPEQFIRVQSDGIVTSKPIKGTRPRGASAQEDELISAELQSNEKERAENLMIVDLMRNDIGKVAKVGSVTVPKLFEVESYATVHQLVSTVDGQLGEGFSAWSAISACFPGGSMTGAPKIRAMELISGLENGARGVYSGCVGYLGVDGSAEFAMTIRSIVFRPGFATIGVGGGITIDSNIEAEVEETKLKANALLKALNATDPWA